VRLFHFPANVKEAEDLPRRSQWSDVGDIYYDCSILYSLHDVGNGQCLQGMAPSLTEMPAEIDFEKMQKLDSGPKTVDEYTSGVLQPLEC
jgi:hypothetical protein